MIDKQVNKKTKTFMDLNGKKLNDQFNFLNYLVTSCILY